MKKILYILCVFLMLAIGQLLAATHYIGDSASEGFNVSTGDTVYSLTTLTIVMHTGSPVIYTAPSGQDLTLTEVNFYADANGTVTPFVAIYDGVDRTKGSSYTILAIGDALTVTGGSGLENRAFTVSGTNPIVRVSPGDQIIAGYLQAGGKVIRYAQAGSGVGDYIRNGDSLTGQSVGDPLSADDSYGFDKTMKFNIGFEAASVPKTIFVSSSKSGTAPSFSTVDLAQTQYLSSSGTGGWGASEHAELFNGLIGNTDGDASDIGEVSMTSANIFTVVFDTSLNTTGYDITGIDTICGWDPVAGGRSNQGYSIELGFIDGSTATLVDAAHWEPNSPSSYWTKVSFSSGDGNALDSSTLVTNGISVAGTGVIAKRVKSITFDISENANPGANVIAREFDIFGVPSPAGSIFGVY